MKAEEFRQIRMNAGLTQQDLGTKLFPQMLKGSAGARVSSFENGKKIPMWVATAMHHLSTPSEAYPVNVTPKDDPVLVKMLALAKLDTYKARIQTIELRIRANDFSNVETW